MTTEQVRALILEEAAKAIESRIGRADTAHGGMGQILANTQDEEARQCAGVIRALLAQAQPAPETKWEYHQKICAYCAGGIANCNEGHHKHIASAKGGATRGRSAQRIG